MPGTWQGSWWRRFWQGLRSEATSLQVSVCSLQDAERNVGEKIDDCCQDRGSVRAGRLVGRRARALRADISAERR
jgi:hypothetical protein